MTIRKNVQRTCHRTESGLNIPTGIVSDISQSSTQTYLEIKEKAYAIEKLYSENKVPLPSSCDLVRLIENAKTLSDKWDLNRAKGETLEKLLRVYYLDRIADAVLQLKNFPGCSKYLTDLTSGSLNFLERTNTKAKDIFWEIELWALLKKQFFMTCLFDPPDIVVDLEDGKIGIACKKLYSEKHVQNVLSEAVSQIESSFDFGIVAINLDDLLVPAQQILSTPNQQTMEKIIDNLNAEFLKKHQRHLQKYLTSGRLLAALVSTSIIADLQTERIRLHNARKVQFWNTPELTEEKKGLLNKFRTQLMN